MEQVRSHSSANQEEIKSVQQAGRHPWWDARTILSQIPQIASHPSWIASYIREGRAGVLKRIVLDSLMTVRSQPVPESLYALKDLPLKTILGKIGAPQELLYYVVRLSMPRIVIETGVYWGISSAFLLAGLHDNGFGNLYSVDLPGGTQEPLKPNESTGFVVPSDLRNRWTLKLGRVRNIIPQLMKQLPSVDLYFHDADHSYGEMIWEFDTFLRWSMGGSLLVADDIDANSAYFDFARMHPESVEPLGVLARRVGLLRRIPIKQCGSPL